MYRSVEMCSEACLFQLASAKCSLYATNTLQPILTLGLVREQVRKNACGNWPRVHLSPLVITVSSTALVVHQYVLALFWCRRTVR